MPPSHEHVRRVEVWSDLACPWCYIGKRRLEAALRDLPREHERLLVWRAFELDPAAPRERVPRAPYAERLARKYGTSVAEAELRLADMTAVARREGLDLRFDRIRPGNTFDAHRLLALAAERGKQDQVAERFLRGYFTEGEAIGDQETLARLAAEAGLDAEEARAVLTGGAYEAQVRADEARADDLLIRGVPCFLIDGRERVSGAQPPEVLRKALIAS